MPKKKFVPMTGLDNLTEEEKQQYYLDACKHFGIPAELNLLEFLWLDDAINGKHLVLYCKRAATDMIRRNFGISIDEVKETITSDFVMFTAKGHDSTGRTDVAVGSASIKGLFGRQLENAIMTAETRSTRRLTLKIVGGGLLDETEVHEHPVVTQADVQPVQNITALPVTRISVEPGRDITDLRNEKKANITKIFIPEWIDFLEKTPDQPESLSDAASPTPVQEVSQIQAPAVETRRKKRRKSGAVVLDENFVDSSVTDLLVEGLKPSVQRLTTEEQRIEHIKEKKAANSDNDLIGSWVSYPEHTVMTLPPVQIPIQAPLLVKDLPSPVQKKEYEKRLFAYTNDVLRKGKMKPCEGIGGINYKLAAFVRLMFPNRDEKQLTVNQWETFFGYMDGKIQEVGPEGLVKIINSKIGAKE